jgi:enoyl-CoA hydratase/carnithine racemase
MSLTRLELHGDHGDVAELVLDAPPLNLFTPEVCDDLRAALTKVPPHARVLLLRAEGKAFCAGVDVSWFTRAQDAAEGSALMSELLALTHALEALAMPTLAVVHGLNLTIGLELALACDLMWASEGARMGLVETTVGLTPGAGGTQRLVARCGAARAADLVITGRIATATELHAWGVVNELRPAATLLAEARAYAATLATGATTAMALGKELIRVARDHGLAAADAATAEISGRAFDTEDLRIGVASLLAEGPGKAVYTGR